MIENAIELYTWRIQDQTQQPCFLAIILKHGLSNKESEAAVCLLFRTTSSCHVFGHVFVQPGSSLFAIGFGGAIGGVGPCLHSEVHVFCNQFYLMHHFGMLLQLVYILLSIGSVVCFIVLTNMFFVR